MVKYKKVLDTEDMVRYEYFPEGKSICGFVSYNKKTKQPNIDSVVDGYGRTYACKVIHRILKYAETGIYEDSGMVAWY